MPACVQWIFWPARLIYKYVKILRLDMWIIKGAEKSSGCELILAFAGRIVNKNYIVSLAFDSQDKEDYLGKKWLWNIEKIAKVENQNCSLIITETPYLLHTFIKKRGNSFFIPNLVYGEINISGDSLSHLIYKNTSLKSDLIKIKKNELSFVVMKELPELHNFYYNMLLPHITKSFGNQAVIPDYASMEHEFIKHHSFYELVLIKRKEEYIAGSLLHYKKNIARLQVVGVKNGDLGYIQEGAMGAVFYFSVFHSAEIGMKKFDFGGSRAFFNDGILRYKNKWRQTLYNNKDIGFLCKIISKSDGLRGFLLNNPLIYEGKKGLFGALFITNNCDFLKEDFAKILKKYLLKGLSKLVIFQLGQTQQKETPIVPEEYANKIEFCSAEELF